jgi:hypothetical protein
MTKRHFFFAIVILIVIFLAIYIGGLEYIGSLKEGSIVYEKANHVFNEAIKFYLQFLLITVFGAILITEYNRQRKRSDDLKDFMKNLNKTMIGVYQRTKRVRWDLKVAQNKDGIPFSAYKEAIDKLVEIKSALDLLQYEVSAYDPAFFRKQDPQKINQSLKAMENYIRIIVKEYSKIEQEAEVLTANMCPAVFLFITPGTTGLNDEKSDFTINFRENFKHAFKELTKSRYSNTE